MGDTLRLASHGDGVVLHRIGPQHMGSVLLGAASIDQGEGHRQGIVRVKVVWQTARSKFLIRIPVIDSCVHRQLGAQVHVHYKLFRGMRMPSLAERRSRGMLVLRTMWT